MESQSRSLFAQALHDLMIGPGIYPIEFWHKLLGPVGINTTPGFVPTPVPIEDWFADKSLPKDNHLDLIVSTCQEGNLAIFLAYAGSGDLDDTEFRDYVERFKSGADAQTKALDRMYEVLDQLAWEVSPMSDQLPEI